MGRYKTTKQVAMKIDYKLFNQILGFKKQKTSFRQASKDFAEYVDELKWKNISLRKKHR